MKKIFLRNLAVFMTVSFLVGTPSAHAIFGIRAARTALAARRAEKMAEKKRSPEDAGAVKKAENHEKDRLGSEDVASDVPGQRQAE